MPAIQNVLTVTPDTDDDLMKEFESLLLRRSQASTKVLRTYYYDPVAFARECINWPEGKSLAPYQARLLRRICKSKKVAGRAPHGTGKTAMEAIAVLWFAITRDAAGTDWKCITTAGAWRQLEKYLWPEIHKWAKLIRWELVGRAPFTRHELLRLNLQLEHGFATAVASDNAAYIEGAHADSIFYIFDEAKAIPAETFDAAEGAFSGGEAAGEAFGLAMSTPGEPNGRFYEIHVRKHGYEDWYPIHIRLEEAVAAGRIDPDWAVRRGMQWGVDSALYANRVLGEFHSADEDGVIPLSWVEAAVERWRINKGRELGPLGKIGADIARSGDDSTILALRYGNRIHELRATHHEDTMKTVGRIGGVLIANPGAQAIVDTDGLGAGVTDRLREQDYPVYAFHAGAKSDKRDRSKELGFINVRAAAWWNLRELLDPAYGSDLELPEDPELLGDLTAPHWTVESNSRIKVEAKADIKKRLGRSTDRADAVVQAFWEDRKKRKRRMGDISDVGERLPTGPEYATAAA